MKKRWPWVVGGAVVLLAAVAAYLLIARPPEAELLGLVAGGGERQLRDPMRPAGTGPRVLVFALDGVGDDELLAAVRSGRATAIAGLLGAEREARLFDHGYAVPGVMSILPSTTIAAWASLFTGAGPAHTGVPGNEWFAREEMRFYAPAPVSVEGIDDALESYTDDLLGGALRVPTVYERADVRAYVSLSHIHRGADLLIVPAADALGDLIAAALSGVSEGDESVEQEAYIGLDLAAVDNVADAIGTHGLADLQVIYFPGVDLYTHVAPEPLARQRGYVTEAIDPAIARILELYRRAGALDDTYVLFVADHGHTPVLTDDRHALSAEGDDEPVAVLEQVGFRVRPLKLALEDDERNFQATVAYQGAFAYVYLADRSTCAAEASTCDWMRPPRLEEDVLPVVRAFDAANRTGAGVPALQGTLDLILARTPRPPTEPALPFQVWDGSKLVPIGDYMARNPRPDLLDFERRLESLAAGPYGHRAGDVLLLARSGSSRPIDERFYFSAPYRSWHGSPDAQDSRIPLLIAHARENGTMLRARVRAAIGAQPRQEDITALILALLGR
ncbi:MAG TPA: alkaline phosphatase family protein [Longimicrobiales bacterium]